MSRTSIHVVSLLALFFFSPGGAIYGQPTLYWSEPDEGRIRRLNLETRSVENVLTAELIAPDHLVVDAERDRMCWSRAWRRIQCARLDGSDVTSVPGDITEAPIRFIDGTDSLIVKGFDRESGHYLAAVDLVTGGMERWRDSLPYTFALGDDHVFWVDDGVVYRARFHDGPDEALFTIPPLDDVADLAVDEQEGWLYWIDFYTAISRAHLDGSEITVIAEADSPTRVSLGDGKIYWTVALLPWFPEYAISRSGYHPPPDTILPWLKRANLDGREQETIVSVSVPSATADFPEAFTVAGGKVYWTAWRTGSIFRCNEDGDEPEVVIGSGLGTPDRLALDPVGRTLYWAEPWSHRVRRSNLDGSNPETFLSTPPYSTTDLSVDTTKGVLYGSNNWGSFGPGVADGHPFRMPLQGGDFENLARSVSEVTPVKIEVDVGRNTIYYSVIDSGEPDSVRSTPGYQSTPAIVKARLDSTHDEVWFVPEVDEYYTSPHPDDIIETALDSERGILYWSHRDVIGKVTLDGTGREDLGLGQVGYWTVGLTYDAASDVLYWASVDDSYAQIDGIGDDPEPEGGTRIMRASLSDRIPEVLVELDDIVVGDLVLDPGIPSIGASTEASLPEHARVVGLYPNPSSRLAVLDLQVDRAQRVRIDVLDITGRRVLRAFDSFVSGATRQRVPIDVASLPSGLYYCRVVGTQIVESRPLVVAR